MSLRSMVSPSTNMQHTTHQLLTLNAPEAPREVYLSTRVFSFACSSSVHSRSMRCAFSLVIGISGFPLASFDSNHLLIIPVFAICIIWCATSCWASSISVRIACIKLFTVEYNTSAPYLFHLSIIHWIVRCTWKHPYRLKTPVIEWMESRCSSGLKLESNFCIYRNLPAHTVFSLAPMGLIKHPKTPCTVEKLAVAWWFRSRC